jgi:hypothetical protein
MNKTNQVNQINFLSGSLLVRCWPKADNSSIFLKACPMLGWTDKEYPWLSGRLQAGLSPAQSPSWALGLYG